MNGTTERSERVRKYFIEKPEKPSGGIWAVLVITFSILIIKGGHLQPSVAGVFLIIIGLTGLCIVIRWAGKMMKQYKIVAADAALKATDKEMDDWLDAGCSMILDKAKDRLGLEDDDIKVLPLLLDGPGTRSSIAAGNDDKLRFNYHRIFLLFLTEHKIAMYLCAFDLGTGEIQEDRTKEFAIKDITNLETRSATTIIYMNSGKKRVNGLQTLSLYTSGGNVQSVDYLYPQDAAHTIRAIRRMIEEYKNRY